MDRLQAMKTFVRVVEAGSFSAVAHEADTTQSAVSKQVAALERALGARLLARTTRSLALTEEGERYFEQARRIVADVAEAESSLCQGASRLSGWLRVAASVAFGRLHLLPVVRAFLDANPDVRVDLRLHDGFVDLVEQGIDVAVRLGPLEDSSLVARRVGASRRWPLAHRDYLRALPAGLPAPREPEDLQRHECIVYTENPHRGTWTFTAGAGAPDEPGSARVVRVGPRLQTNSSEVVRSAVLSGMGIAYAPSWLFTSEIANGEVQRLLPDWEPPASPIQLVSPRERLRSAKVLAFGALVERAFAGGL